MGWPEDSGISAESARRFDMWMDAFKALCLKDENAWRMLPDNTSKFDLDRTTLFISVVRMTDDDDMIRRLIHTFPTFTSDALVRLAHRLRVEVVMARLD